MEEGSLRCDANVSVRPVGTTAFGTKVEIKNMNSVRSLERALDYEIERQTAAFEAGRADRAGDASLGRGRRRHASMRSKEEAFDYRYFPEPDIPAIEPDPSWVEEIRAALPGAAEGSTRPIRGRVRSEARGGARPGRRPRVRDAVRRGVGAGADPVPAANWVTQDAAALRNSGVGGCARRPRISPMWCD